METECRPGANPVDGGVSSAEVARDGGAAVPVTSGALWALVQRAREPAARERLLAVLALAGEGDERRRDGDGDAVPRWIAVLGLGPLAAEDAEVAERLTMLLGRERSEAVLAEAARWLAPLAPRDGRLRRRLLIQAAGGAALPRRAALLALVAVLRAGGEAVEVRDALLQQLGGEAGDAGEPDEGLLAEALVALWPQALRDHGLAQELAETAARLQGEAAELAAAALARLLLASGGGLRAALVPVLVRLLGAEHDGHAEAARILAPLAPQEPALREALLARHRGTRVPVASVLGSLLAVALEPVSITDPARGAQATARAQAGREAAQEALRQLRVAPAASDASAARAAPGGAEDEEREESAEAQALLALGTHADPAVREEAVAALAEVLEGTSTLAARLRPRVVALLRARLGDESAAVRRRAGQALMGIVAADSDLQEALTCWLASADPRERQAACAALAQVVTLPLQRPLRATLLGLARDEQDEHVRREALLVLAPLACAVALAPDEREAIQGALLGALGDPGLRVRCEAAAAPLLPRTRALLEEEVQALAAWAALRAEALCGLLGVVAAPERAVVDPALREAAVQGLAACAEVLTALPGERRPSGPGERDDVLARVRAALVVVLADPAPRVRNAAARALAARLGDDPGLLERLWPWLGASSRETRWQVAEGFAHQPDPALRARLRELLRSPRSELRQGAAWALSASGVVSAEEGQALRGLLTERRGDWRWQRRLDAARALLLEPALDGALSALRQRALQVVQEALEEGASFAGPANDDLLRAAASALVGAAPEQEVVRQALRLLLHCGMSGEHDAPLRAALGG